MPRRNGGAAARRLRPSTSLQEPPALLSEAYLCRLEKGKQLVEDFSKEKAVDWAVLSKQPKALDRFLDSFVVRCYTEDTARGRVVEAVLAVQKELQVSRSQLLRTWEHCWGWRLGVPSQPRKPLPCSWMRALCIVAWAFAANTEGRSRAMWIGAAILWRIGFWAFLRPLEMLNLRVETIILPEELVEDDNRIVVIVESPKNMRWLGTKQFVLFTDGTTLAWLRWWIRGLTPSSKIFPGGRVSLINCLNGALAALGLDGMGVALGSFRAGGATDQFRKEGNVGTLQFKGRWRSATTLHHYLQEASAALMDMRTSAKAQAAIMECLSWESRMTTPPTVSAVAWVGRPVLRQRAG